MSLVIQSVDSTQSTKHFVAGPGGTKYLRKCFQKVSSRPLYPHLQSNLAHLKGFHYGLRSVCKLRAPTGNRTCDVVRTLAVLEHRTFNRKRSPSPGYWDARLFFQFRCICLFSGLWQRPRTSAIRPATVSYAGPELLPGRTGVEITL
jgi:hypothetical protein